MTSPSNGIAPTTLRWSSRLLAGTVWASASLFGLYILAFYALASLSGEMARWNRVLPELFVRGGSVGNAGMALHFLGGGLLLVLGSIQFLTPLRTALPRLHRWTGRVYVASAALAGLGGLAFIGVRGTVGGWVMDVGFAGYGLLTLLAAVQTARYAIARELDTHRAWAVRLYALAIGSWLYRMDYGFWILLTDGLGHAEGFRGPFDYVMDFAFYLPNLAIAELYLRRDAHAPPTWLAVVGSLAMLVATGFVLLGSYFFALHYWLPGIGVGIGAVPG